MRANLRTAPDRAGFDRRHSRAGGGGDHAGAAGLRVIKGARPGRAVYDRCHSRGANTPPA